MKVESNAYDVGGNMGGERVAMAIAAEDMAHIMGVLTDLYKDRLLAVIREYSTNALDAHIEAGFSGPIDITLPNVLSPTLTIRDYGIGLDAEGIRTVYSQYGRSTKRDSNDQVGMLGLGCKSALTYTSQFTVESVKNGFRVTVLVSRDEDGGASMQILGDVPTDEANGTKVSVSIRREDLSLAETKSRTFFSYWPEGSVLVNGAVPERFKGLQIADGLFIGESEYEGGYGVGGYRRPTTSAAKIVMGNVAYSHDVSVGLPSDAQLVAFVPIGTVTPVPSREALRDSQTTKTAVAQIEKDFEGAIVGAIQRQIDKADSPQAAIRVLDEWAKYVPSSAKNRVYRYKGIDMPKSWEPGDGTMVSTATFSDHGGPPFVKNRGALEITLWPSTFWVSGFAPEKFTSQHHKKLRKWCAERSIGGDGSIQRFAALSGAAPVSPFIDAALTAPWEEVRKIRLDPVARTPSSGRIPGSYDIVTEASKHSQTGVPGDSLRQDKPLFWLRGSRHNMRAIQPSLAAMFPEFTLVALGENRIAKWQRDVPASIEVNKAIRDNFDAWVAKQAPDDLKALAMIDERFAGDLKAIDPLKVKDPAVRAAVTIAKRDVAKLETEREAFRRVVNVEALRVSITNPLEKYPLFDTYAMIRGRDKRRIAHCYAYMNAIFEAGI